MALNTSTAVAAIGAVGGAYIAYSVYNKYKKNKLPEEWTQVGTLKELYVYPIKSCGPVTLDRVECSLMGVKKGWLRDRVLMVVDAKYNFITARAYPELLGVETSVKSSVLTMKYKNMEPLHVNLAEIVSSHLEPKTATVWSIEVPVFDCGLEASEWFTTVLARPGATYRLVYYAANNSRKLINSLKLYKFQEQDTGAFPDETSYNLINEVSIQELNTRLKTSTATVQNYRPNFVVAGGQPYAEDSWKFVKIGDNVFEIIKPCTRCLLTTIDPETGVRNMEALETLKRYRQIENEKLRKAAGNSPRLGLQMALRSSPGGLISVNDPVYYA
ncbi:mitochondrial amidoxime-reducing component 1 isoform X2 [Leptidea sinapis]|uniref:mitochondrial amidoxime-reducing component 1 isoform X2 n=1 Tax=Leptidea sinapis TaxID=189913 RepID=UPI0021C292E5|nr:mitochondrial amidoxime-reducing component 1 isoform X2 [Leptidea sinapis]